MNSVREEIRPRENFVIECAVVLRSIKKVYKRAGQIKKNIFLRGNYFICVWSLLSHYITGANLEFPLTPATTRLVSSLNITRCQCPFLTISDSPPDTVTFFTAGL